VTDREYVSALRKLLNGGFGWHMRLLSAVCAVIAATGLFLVVVGPTAANRLGGAAVGIVVGAASAALYRLRRW
jgi:hypothetical protein